MISITWLCIRVLHFISKVVLRPVLSIVLSALSNDECFTVTSIKGWFTLATESEAESESEAQGALRSSVNQKEES